MHGPHCILWIDHERAHVVFCDKAEPVSVAIASSNAHGHGHVHHKAGTMGSGKVALDGDFAKQIERQLEKCGEFLVVGPGNAKLEFIRHVHHNAPALDKKLVGVESLDHMSDAQLAEFGKAYFRKFDRMHSSNDEVLAGLAAHRQPSL